MTKANTGDTRLSAYLGNKLIHKIINCLITIIALALVQLILLHDISGAGTDPAAFLNMGIGARAMGMGGAFISVADDSTAIYWNPAGLGTINKYSIAAMGQSVGAGQWETIKDISPSFQFIGFTFPVNTFRIPYVNNETNTFGFGIVSLSLDEIPLTSVDQNGVIIRDTFADSESAYYFSYGFPVADQNASLYFGTTIKYIMQSFSKISDGNASGYDIEAGMLCGFGNLNLGLVFQRGVQLMWANGRRDSGPMVTKLGISKKLPVYKSLSLLGSADLVQRQGQPLNINLGGEFGYEMQSSNTAFKINGLYLRLGFDGYTIEDRYGYRNTMNNSLNLNTGVGVDISFLRYSLQLDYVSGFYRLGDKSRFTVLFYF